MSGEIPFKSKLSIKPIIISNNKKVLLNRLKVKPVIVSKLNFRKQVPVYQDDVIYKSSNCDFLKGEPQDVLIVNRINLVNKKCRTIARLTSKTTSVEITSDNVCSLLGQKNYDTVLSALGSVFNEETKVRGILALLTPVTKYNSISIQADMVRDSTSLKNLADKVSQTDGCRIDAFTKERQRKRIRRQAPYVVQEHGAPKIKKCIINVHDFPKKEEVKEEIKHEEKEKELIDLKLIIDEDSNMSCGSHISMSSIPSIPDVLDKTSMILSNIVENVTDKPVNSAMITVQDGSNIMIPAKPEDQFHIATEENLKNVTHHERIKLLWHQAYIDFKLCMEQDEDGYLPLHVAVLNNDADLVRRQCLALKARHESVDIPASGMSALHMSIRHNASADCTRQLLRQGADPLQRDADGRSALHLAADAPALLQAIVEHCDSNARQVLMNNGTFWQPEMGQWTDSQLTQHLYEQIGEIFDDQGYTPLMLASRAGCPQTVSLLASRACRVDTQAPCGATALLHAVSRACERAKETGNRTTAPENYLKTIEILVENGADPTIENNSGCSVNTLLTEFNICALSMTIANKMTAMKHGKLAHNLMLYKEKDGRIGYKQINGYKELTNSDCKVKEENKINNNIKIEKVDIKEEKKSPELNIIKDKITGLNLIKGDRIHVLNEIHSSVQVKEEKTDKVVIVENIALKKDVLSNINIPTGSTVVSKPKEYVLKPPFKMTNTKTVRPMNAVSNILIKKTIRKKK